MPRHGSIADQLAAVMAYRSRPEPAAPIEPIQTNWTVTPANDNNAEDVVDFGFERDLLVTPSVSEVMRNVVAGPIEHNDAGQIVGIGRLRFSDGANTEQGYAVGPEGDTIRADFRMPAGAMLGTVEKDHQAAGGKGSTDAQIEQSNLYFAWILGTIEPRYIKRTKRRNGPSLTAEQSRAELAKTIANTPVMPVVKRYKAGLPCGTPRVAESFMSLQKASCASSGAIMWQDMCTSIVSREIWDETLAALNARDKKTLDAALVASTLADIAPGGSDRGARKRGKRLLSAANDNLVAAMKKAAA